MTTRKSRPYVLETDRFFSPGTHKVIPIISVTAYSTSVFFLVNRAIIPIACRNKATLFMPSESFPNQL